MDQRLLRDVFGQFCTGVTVVCTQDAASVRYGITVNSFSSLSLDPPLAMFAIVKDSDTLQPLRQSRKFSINILSGDQQEISNRLAKKGGAEKMAGIATRSEVTGAPVLESSIAFLDCTLHDLYEGGDHLIVVGEIKALAIQQKSQPLLYFRGGYRGLMDK